MGLTEGEKSSIYHLLFSDFKNQMNSRVKFSKNMTCNSFDAEVCSNGFAFQFSIILIEMGLKTAMPELTFGN